MVRAELLPEDKMKALQDIQGGTATRQWWAMASTMLRWPRLRLGLRWVPQEPTPLLKPGYCLMSDDWPSHGWSTCAAFPGHYPSEHRLRGSVKPSWRSRWQMATLWIAIAAVWGHR
jgi:hypothetical protein